MQQWVKETKKSLFKVEKKLNHQTVDFNIITDKFGLEVYKEQIPDFIMENKTTGSNDIYKIMESTI